MASQKREKSATSSVQMRLGADPWIAALELDLTLDELWLLRLSPYNAIVTNVVHTPHDRKVAERLIQLGLLEKDTTLESGSFRVRCTDAGEVIAKPLTVGAAKKIRSVVQTRIRAGELTWAERIVSAFMYRVLCEDMLRGQNDEMESYFYDHVLCCREFLREAQNAVNAAGARDAKVLRANRGRIVQELLKDSALDDVRVKHHPDAVLRTDFVDGDVPFPIETDDGEDEP